MTPPVFLEAALTPFCKAITERRYSTGLFGFPSKIVTKLRQLNRELDICAVDVNLNAKHKKPLHSKYSKTLLSCLGNCHKVIF